MGRVPGRITRWIAFVLRWGSYLSALLLAIGLAWVVTSPDVPIQAGPPMPLSTLGVQLAEQNPYAVIQLGILLLLLTPLVRLVTAAVSFELAGERRYALVSLAVLSLILLALLGVA